MTEQRALRYYRAALSGAVLLLLLLTGGKTEYLAPCGVVLILLVSVGLVFLKNTHLLTLPFLLLCLMLIFCYDSFNVFIGYVWFAPVPVIALVVHILRLRPQRKLGRSFYPLVAVALASCLGGIGMISAAEYFAPISLFYMFGLGPGLVLVYVLMKNEITTRADERCFLADLSVLAVTAAVVVVGYYLLAIPRFANEGLWQIIPQWSNNVGTLLMLSFPTLFVRARRNMAYLPLALFVALVTVFCGSNATIPLAGLETLVCLGYLAWAERRPRYRIFLWVFVGLLTVAAVSGVIAFVVLDPVQNLSYSIRDRLALLKRGWENFLENPVFGSGFGYRGNADLYSGKQGTINWYHLFVAQVVGGLGVVGILAWGYQLIVRFRLAYRTRGTNAFAFGLCYLGLLLMSMLNPGEFCPVPYAFLAVTFFVMLERHDPNPFVPFWHKLKGKGDH